LSNLEAFRGLYEQLNAECFDTLGINGHDSAYFSNERHYTQYCQVATLSPDDYLFEEARYYRARLVAARDKLHREYLQLESNRCKAGEIRDSRVYRLGERLASIEKKIRPGFAGGRKVK